MGAQFENHCSKETYVQWCTYPGILYNSLINDLLLIKSNTLVSIPFDLVTEVDIGEFLYLLVASCFYQDTGVILENTEKILFILEVH